MNNLINTPKPNPLLICVALSFMAGLIGCFAVELLGFGDAFVRGEIGIKRLAAILFATSIGILIVFFIAWAYGSHYLERMQKAREMDRIQNGNDLW